MKSSSNLASVTQVKTTSSRCRWARRGQAKMHGPMATTATEAFPVMVFTSTDGESNPTASSRTVCTRPFAQSRPTCN